MSKTRALVLLQIALGLVFLVPSVLGIVCPENGAIPCSQSLSTAGMQAHSLPDLAIPATDGPLNVTITALLNHHPAESGEVDFLLVLDDSEADFLSHTMEYFYVTNSKFRLEYGTNVTKSFNLPQLGAEDGVTSSVIPSFWVLDCCAFYPTVTITRSYVPYTPPEDGGNEPRISSDVIVSAIAFVAVAGLCIHNSFTRTDETEPQFPPPKTSTVHVTESSCCSQKSYTETVVGHENKPEKPAPINKDSILSELPRARSVVIIATLFTLSVGIFGGRVTYEDDPDPASSAVGMTIVCVFIFIILWLAGTAVEIGGGSPHPGRIVTWEAWTGLVVVSLQTLAMHLQLPSVDPGFLGGVFGGGLFFCSGIVAQKLSVRNMGGALYLIARGATAAVASGVGATSTDLSANSLTLVGLNIVIQGLISLFASEKNRFKWHGSLGLFMGLLIVSLQDSYAGGLLGLVLFGLGARAWQKAISRAIAERIRIYELDQENRKQNEELFAAGFAVDPTSHTPPSVGFDAKGTGAVASPAMLIPAPNPAPMTSPSVLALDPTPLMARNDPPVQRAIELASKGIWGYIPPPSDQ